MDAATAPTRPGVGRDAASAAPRLLWIGLPGPELDDESAALLAQGVGGVVLFTQNISGADQLRRLTDELRRRAARPLRIAIDHEGGHVARVGAPVTRFPSAMAVAATRSPELAYAVARAAGRELRGLGIDVNLAPVLDVALDPRNASVGSRSFGSSVDQVARFGAATVRGYQDAGIAATAKHFPGHGRTPVDSHLALPSVGGGLPALRQYDLPPFRAAIEAGVQLVMASHVAFEGLTDGLPSTLAPRLLTGLLREELGFGGLVVTDAMRMRALADRHPIPAACVQSVTAGADVVLPLERQEETLRALTQAIAAGELTAERVDEALTRIDRLDHFLASPNPIDAGADGRLALPDADHLALARTVAQRSLTLLRGHEVLPLRPSASVAVIEFASRRASPVEEGQGHSPTLGSALARRLTRVREVIVGSEGSAGEAAAQPADVVALEAAGIAALQAAEAADFVLLATRDAYLWPEDQALIAQLLTRARQTMVIALRNPYDLAVLPTTSAAAAVYADVPATFEALADALTGRAGWPGVLPMELRVESWT